MTDVRFRPLHPPDWPAVQAIYREGIETGDATFEPDPPTWRSFDAGRDRDLRLVAEAADGAILGWVAAGPTSTREVYRGVVEHSIYIAAHARGQGVGRGLLGAFVALADDHGIWTIQASLFPENVASLRLHERLGFRVVGRRERIARMTHGPLIGMWRDTVLIERRRP